MLQYRNIPDREMSTGNVHIQTVDMWLYTNTTWLLQTPPHLAKNIGVQAGFPLHAGYWTTIGTYQVTLLSFKWSHEDPELDCSSPTQMEQDKIGMIEVKQVNQYIVKVGLSGRVTLSKNKFLRKYTPFCALLPTRLWITWCSRSPLRYTL